MTFSHRSPISRSASSVDLWREPAAGQPDCLTVRPDACSAGVHSYVFLRNRKEETMRQILFAISLPLLVMSSPAFAQKDHSRINIENWSMATKTTIVSVKIGKTLTNFAPPISANFPGQAPAANEMLGICLQDVRITFGNGQLFVIPAKDPGAFDSCHNGEIRIIDRIGGGYELKFD
jgi:hypothetical protein